MKNFMILTIVAIIVTSCVAKNDLIQGQKTNNLVNTTRTNTYEVVYDFKKGVFEKNNLQLHVNTPTVFKIKNINRLAYNISISSNDTILAETYIADELDKSIKETTSNKSTEIISNKNGVISSPKLDLSSIVENDFVEFSKNADLNNTFLAELNSSKNINQLIAEREKYTNKNTLLELQKNYLSEEVKTENLKTDSISKGNLSKLKEKLARVEIDISSTLDSITQKSNKIKVELDKQQIDLLKKFDQDNIAFQEAFYKLNQVYSSVLMLQECYGDIKVVADYPYMSKTKYQTEFKSACREKAKSVLTQKESLINFRDYSKQVGIKYSNLKYNPYLSKFLNYGGITKLYAHADYIKELADQMSNEVIDMNIPIVLQKIQHLLELLEEEEAYQYVSAPIQPTQDAAIFKIKIQKKADNNSDVSDEKSFKHTEFTYGGTRVDFSLGLAASYFKNAEVYEFGVRNDSTVLSKKSDKLIAPALVGLITMSYRRTQYFSLGASAGLGIDVVNGKVQLSNFFIGPTVLFGKYDRLFLTGGLSLRNVQQLKSGYKVDDVVTSGADDINNYLSDKYSVGGFLSLTYNLTKGVRANVKKLK